MIAEEYKQRETKKPINAKAYLKNLIYKKIYLDEVGTVPEKPLFDENEIIEASAVEYAKDPRNVEIYIHYMTLDQWIRTNYRYVEAAEALARMLLYVNSSVLEKGVVEYIKPSQIYIICGDYVARVQRTIREITAYNTMIDFIKSDTRLPEIVVYQWELTDLLKGVEMYQAAIEEYKPIIETVNSGDLKQLLVDCTRDIKIPHISKADIERARLMYQSKKAVMSAMILDQIRDYLALAGK